MANNDLIYRYYTPLAGWIFMTIWMSMLGMFIHVVMRDGLPGQMPPEIEIMIFALFGFFGIFASMHVFYEPLIFLKIESNKLIVQKIWLFKTRTIKGRLADIPMAQLVTDKDTDGDNHYTAVMKLEDDEDVCFFQSYTKKKTEKAVQDVNKRIGTYKT